MMDERQYTRRTRASVPLSPDQARFLERSRSAQRFVTQKFEERELRCHIDVNNRVVHVASENDVEPEFVSRELGTLIAEHSFEDNLYQAVLLENVPDGGVMTLTDDAVVIRDGSKLLQGVSTYKSLFGISLGLPANDVDKLVKDIASRNRCTSQIAYVSSNGVVNDDIQGAERLDRLGEDPYVKLVGNKLQKQKAGVIVNNSHRNLNLRVGTVSAALLKYCGEEVQHELRKRYPRGIENGEYAVSSSGCMDTCKEIYHGALPASKGLDASPIELCYQNMIKLVYNCLRQASNSGHMKIAFPALGTGALAYPVEDAAYLMYKAVRLFLQHCHHTTLKRIYFVLHPSSPREMKQIFLAHKISQTVDTLLVDALRIEETQVSGKLVSEVLFRVGPTLVKVVNADLKQMCHKSCSELVLGNKRGIQDLPGTKTAMDTDSTTSRTVIHSYMEKENGKDLDRAVKRGLKRGMKENIHSLALSLPTIDRRLRSDIASTTVSILQGVKDSRGSVLVFAVFIPDRDHYLEFVTAARGIYISEKPSVGLANLLDLSDDQIRTDLRLEETGKQVFLTVTSDSEQINRKVAKEIQKALHSNNSQAFSHTTHSAR